MQVSPIDSVFNKIGGIDALHLVIDSFYDKVLGDETINGFFHNTDMDIQRGKMKAFLMMALGGPVKFTGMDLRKAHAKLVAQGLSDIHFDVVSRHLEQSLKENKVSPKTVQIIISVVESLRADVLNRN